jgi:predicted neuraminidase
MRGRKMKSLYVCTTVASLFAATSSAELSVEKVLGPETPGGTYKHPASIEELPNGDLYIAYHGGEAEYDRDTADFGLRLPKGSTRWSQPKRIADTPNRGEGNAVIWQEPGGLTWLFYVSRYGETWSDSIIKYKYSKDGAETWSDPEIISFVKGLMVRSQPIPLANGDFLLPIYHERGTDKEHVGEASTSLFARFSKKTRQWSFTEEIHSRLGNIQPAVVQFDDNNFLAFCRRGGSYGHVPDGFIVRTESHDGGRTWSPGADTKFPNPNSAVDLIKLRDGHLVMIYNDSFYGERMPLTMRVSSDNGKTWPHVRNIVNKPGDDAAYPYIIETADGRIHGVYTSQERTIINHFVLEEADIRGQGESK